MFHYEEPVFQKKRVLRMEMLEQLRDYPRNYLKLMYQGYSDGIVCGCGITWDSGQLEISPGILYHAGNLYFMEEPYRMECLAEDRMRYLKVQFMTPVREEGRTGGSTRIVLNDQKPNAACEMELCGSGCRKGQGCGIHMRTLRIMRQDTTRSTGSMSPMHHTAGRRCGLRY